MKVFKALYWALVFISLSVTTWAQRGKHGALTVTAANTRINEYTNLTANATAGNLTITVGSNNLNANSRFTAPLQVGDLIMIIQMQGALIKTFNTVPGQDSTYGEILNYNDCGRYEFHQVYALPNATSIVLDCGLQYNYSSAGKTQIVRVPRLSALTVNAGASLTGDAWNGTIGGIVSAEVNGATVINGSVVATGLGFRQGIAANDGNYGGLRYVDMNVGYPEGGEKGESIAGSQADYAALYNGKHSRGAPANGGGGGNSHNAGGGGGANAGIPATWRGYGIVNPAYNASYNLEFPGRAAIVSSGGGKGGYAYSSANLNPATVGPNNGSWGGDGRKNNGGFGGRPLDYSTGRIFLGGGGGAGHVNNLSAVNTGGNGGNGGGMIYFISYGNVTGTGAVIANGNNGVTATGAPTPGNFAGNDSGGGGGAGGTIIFNSTGTVSGISLTANGGLGGNQTIVKNLVFGTVNEAEGPGGGGGGGYIALSAGAPVQNVLGANSGTTNAPPMATFPPNGATNGAPGLSNQSITLYTLTANPVTVCVNNAATLTASSNNPSASFLWYNNIAGPSQIATGAVYTTSVFTAPGSYTFFAAMCPGNYRIPVVVTVTNGPTLTVTSSTICAGQTTTLTASGATTYSWSTGASTSTVAVNPALTTAYTVTGSLSGCSSFTTTTVTVNAASTIAVTSSTVCAGQTATLIAGPAISYTWSNGATSSTNAVTPALTTVYSLTANIGGCNATNTGTVTVNPAPVTSVNSATICAGNSATLTASGATSYSWSTGAITNSIVVTPAANTSYTVTGTQGGCSSSTVAQVIVSAVGALPVNSATICAGQSATLTAGAATSYTWSTGANTSSIVVTPASTTVYTVNATTGGCVSNATTAVTVNPSSTIAVTSSTVCAGQTATLTAGPALSYTWSNGATSSTNAVTPALTTVYSLTANIGGCNATNSGTVTVNPIPVTSASNATICAGNSATLTASGATSYSWSTGALTNSIVVTPAANTSYTVTGTQGGCSSSTVVAVTISSIGAIAINNPTICTGQTATLTAAAATSYSWSTGATTSSITVSPGLTSIYTLSAVVGGCPSLGSATVTVVAPSVPVVNQASVCSGQTATLTAMGASSYSWSTGALTNSIVVSPVSTTIYTVTGNPGSCPANANTTVFVTNTPTVSANSLTICSGQTATLIASGAASYLWNDGTPTASNVVTPVSTAVYTVTGTTGTCSASATAMVIVNPTPTVSAINATICPGQTATVTPSGATQYTFDPGGINAVGTTFTVSPAVTTVYAISGSSNNCVSTGTVSINLGNNLSIAVNNATFCPGNSVVLTASSSATSYTWSTGATTASISVSPSVASVYSVTGSNGSCSGSTTVQVLPGSVPAITVTATPICPGQTSTLSASGANTYTWLPSASISSSIVSSPSAATAYTVIGNSGACDGSSVFTLTISPTPTVSVASVSVCNGGTATLTANGATNYNWLPSGSAGNTLAVTPSVTSTYTVVGSIGSCTSLATATVSLVSGFNLSINSSNICLGQSATLTASAGNTFTWSTGETTASIVVTPSVSTNYSVTAALGSCINSTATTVYVSTPPALSVSPASSEICNGQSIALTASGASSYTWSPGNLTTPVVSVSPSATTIYTVNSSNGICTTSHTLAVFVNTYPTLSVSINTFEICRGEDIIVNANGAANYTLSTPKFNHYTLPHSFKPDANTTLTVTGSNGACTRSTTAFITVHSVDAGFNEEINYADFPAYINFTNTSSPNSSVSWDFGNGISMGNIQTPRVLFEDPRKYLVSLVAIDAFGCKDTVMKVIEAGCGSGDIYVPNSFTPNGDGINDVFAIAGPGVCIANFKGRIFDRWGELLFTMEELSSKWDGQFKGNPVEQGVYVYQFEYQVPGGKTISRTGHINLIR